MAFAFGVVIVLMLKFVRFAWFSRPLRGLKWYRKPYWALVRASPSYISADLLRLKRQLRVLMIKHFLLFNGVSTRTEEARKRIHLFEMHMRKMENKEKRK
jgi:hypothetical protein